MNKNDDIPLLEADEKIRLDINFENIRAKKIRRFRYLALLLLILLALVGAFIFKKSENANEKNEISESNNDAIAGFTWYGAFESEEIFNYCKEVSVSIIAQGQRCSGFVYSSDGWIATAEGVVNEGVKGQIEVILFDGRRFLVESFRQNRESGLILMKIDASNLKSISLDGVGEIFAGEELFTFCTVGNVAEGSSLFSGKVAHIKRSVELLGYDGRARVLKLFQIGILLTEEGVGAPLFNERGEIVGIALASDCDVENERYMIDYAFDFNNVSDVLKMMKNGKRAEDSELFDVIIE